VRHDAPYLLSRRFDATWEEKSHPPRVCINEMDRANDDPRVVAQMPDVRCRLYRDRNRLRDFDRFRNDLAIIAARGQCAYAYGLGSASPDSMCTEVPVG